MKVQVAAAFISLALSSGAFAGQRYLVVMKTSQSFKSAHSTFASRGEFNLKGVTLGNNVTAFSKVDAVVENSLENLNTLVVKAEKSEIEKLKNNPEVAMVEAEIFHPAPKPMLGYVNMAQRRAANTSPAPSQPWGIAAINAPQAWRGARSGSGARVLVLDTGIDTNHPALRKNFEKGQDFTGDSDGSDFSDHVGHGTHVSGTIAGGKSRRGFVGVAPKAHLLMGRVCSDQGCSNVAIANGINWGISEHVDVISMSLGGSMSTPAEKQAVQAADNAGVTVVAASGNDGTNRVSYPAALPTVVAVGAVNSKLEKTDFSQYGPELAVVAPGADVVSTVPMGSGREAEVILNINGQAHKANSTTFEGARELDKQTINELVFVGTGKPEDFKNANVEGKFVLATLGEVKLMQKIQTAIASKAAGMIIYQANAPGLVRGALTQDGSTLDMPVFMIEQAEAQNLIQSLKSGAKVAAGLMTLRTDYASYDGTSMATPHVAGVVALIKAANRFLSPADVRQILKSTAHHLNGPNSNNELGAGLVDAQAAVSAALSANNGNNNGGGNNGGNNGGNDNGGGNNNGGDNGNGDDNNN